MPIKPENRKRYPADWKAIRAEVLERAQHRCEQCQAPNGQMIARGAGDDAGTYMTSEASVFDAATGVMLALCYPMSSYSVDRMTKVVLTIAHLDHVPENCGEPGNRPNLRAWCQRCHLAHDADHHAANAAATRRGRRALGDLFESIQS